MRNDASCNEVIQSKESDLAGTRTQDLRIKSLLLYQLSYEVNFLIYMDRYQRAKGQPKN